MNYVRTTITIPSDTHEYLMTQSFKTKKTLGELVDGMVKQKHTVLSEKEIDANIAKIKQIGARIEKKYGKTDWTRLIREERDRDE